MLTTETARLSKEETILANKLAETSGKIRIIFETP